MKSILLERLVCFQIAVNITFLSEFNSREDQAFSLLHVVEIGSGVHPTSYQMGTGALSPGVMWPERETDHSPPASAEVKKMWIYTTTPSHAFME
jgi:hypothetical protein